MLNLGQTSGKWRYNVLNLIKSVVGVSLNLCVCMNAWISVSITAGDMKFGIYLAIYHAQLMQFSKFSDHAVRLRKPFSLIIKRSIACRSTSNMFSCMYGSILEEAWLKLYLVFLAHLAPLWRAIHRLGSSRGARCKTGNLVMFLSSTE